MYGSLYLYMCYSCYRYLKRSSGSGKAATDLGYIIGAFMKICLIVFYFIVCIISSLDTLYGMKLLGKVEGDLLFLFSVDVFVLIYFVLEDHGIWEYVSVYASQLLS